MLTPTKRMGRHRVASIIGFPHYGTRLLHRPSLLVAVTTRVRFYASSTADGGTSREDDGIDVDTMARPMGYGPFSATAKSRLARERAQAASGTGSASPSVVNYVALETNLNLRLSLANLPHPSQLSEWAYTSAEWRQAFVRLYRTILRLHNKTVAVSLQAARSQGPEAAVSAVTGVQAAASQPASTTSARMKNDKDDFLLRYLLTPEQQEFGNRFVQGEFMRHKDADAVSATAFYASWYDYVLQLASGVTSRDLTEKEKRLLSDEQKETLNSLRQSVLDMRTSQQKPYMP